MHRDNIEGFPFVENISISLPNVVLLTIGIVILHHLFTAFYNLFLHRLRAFPGPLLSRASPVPLACRLIGGRSAFQIADLHKKYGPVVRISPNELAFSDPQAWRDIYGHRALGQDEFAKYSGFYRVFHEPVTALSAGRDEHAMLRRQLSFGFSDRSMRKQEPMIGKYVDVLVEQLRCHCIDSNGAARALNMRDWLTFTTFDIIGDMAFGSPFGCLDSGGYHPWVRLVTSNVQLVGIVRGIMYSSLVAKNLMNVLSRLKVWRTRNRHNHLVTEMLRKRMALGAERPDLIEGLLKKTDEWQFPFSKLLSNASLLIVAGSETTATLLCGAVYFLCTEPRVLTKLTSEVRSAFDEDAEITLNSVARLTYMLAVLNESLRRYPPVAAGMPRVVPKGGERVAGEFIPEDTVVAVWNWAVNYDSALWKDPMGFHPERFMGDPRFAGDKFDAMQPFSTGPRNCIGKNLAYAEMRLILAKIIYNFDMKIADDSRTWLRDNKVYTLWLKPDLNIYLTPVGKH